MSFHLSTCPYCACGCGLLLEERDGRLVGSHPSLGHPTSRGSLCMRGWNAVEASADAERLTHPLLREGSGLVPITWQRAIDEIARCLDRARRAAPAQSESSLLFAVGPGLCNEDAFAVQRLGQNVGAAVSGTDLVGVTAARHALRTVLGKSAVAFALDDVAGADLVWVFGLDPDNCPQVAQRLTAALLGGGSVVTFDVFAGASRSGLTSVLVPPDALGVLPLLLQRAAFESDHIPPAVKEARGFSAFADCWRPGQEPKLPAHPYLPDSTAKDLVRAFLEAKRPAVAIGDRWLSCSGAAQATVQLLQALSLLGAHERVGLCAGEANTWGVTDMLGTEPAFGAALLDLLEPGGPAPSFLLVAGDDLMRRTPRPEVLAQKLAKLSTVVLIDSFPGDLAPFAHVVLPACTFAEIDGTATSTFGLVERFRRVVAAPGEASPHRVWMERLGRRLGYDDWPEAASEWFAAVQAAAPRYRSPALAQLYADDAPYGVALEEVPHLSFVPPALPPSGAAPSGFERRLYFSPHFTQWSTGALSGRNRLLKREVIASTVALSPADLAELETKPGRPVKVVTPHGSAVLTAEEDQHLPPGVLCVRALAGGPAAALRGFVRDAAVPSLGIQPVPARIERA